MSYVPLAIISQLKLKALQECKTALTLRYGTLFLSFSLDITLISNVRTPEGIKSPKSLC